MAIAVSNCQTHHRHDLVGTAVLRSRQGADGIGFAMKKTRCAIYTRKSSEDGLEQEFNSLDAQREACAAYVASQKHEGWVLLPTAYDDGGLSGGSLERPALKQLMADMAAGEIDQIVVYKIDRLTRSLADFSKIVDVLDAAGASFVSVTQSFNTATSMGRLTLNMLLSFAQFEREVTAERIRDKIAASKRKGLWMGGLVPLGYDADGRTLAINATEATTVRTLYALYAEHGTIREVKRHADQVGLTTKVRSSADDGTSGGGPFSRGHIHQILTNPLYAGRIRHRNAVHAGQHPAIIDPEVWERLQGMLQDGAAKTRAKSTARQTSLLCGKIFDETGDRLTPSHTRTKAGKRLRYYVSHRLIVRHDETENTGGWRLPAAELETLIAALTRKMLTAPDAATRLLSEPTADAISALRTRLQTDAADLSDSTLLKSVAHIAIAPGELTMQLDPTSLAKLVSIEPEVFSDNALTVTAPFQMRKRGVETKLILADARVGQDDALIRNISMAHHWFGQIKAGKTFAEIADGENTSKRRIQQVISLAFLAPDIIRDVLDGKQPLGFTSDWCVRHTLPSDWSEQRNLLRTL